MNCSVIYNFNPWCLARIFRFQSESTSHTKSHSYNLYIRPPNFTKYTIILGFNPLLLIQKSTSLVLSNSYYCFLCSLTDFFVFIFFIIPLLFSDITYYLYSPYCITNNTYMLTSTSLWKIIRCNSYFFNSLFFNRGLYSDPVANDDGFLAFDKAKIKWEVNKVLQDQIPSGARLSCCWITLGWSLSSSRPGQQDS